MFLFLQHEAPGGVFLKPERRGIQVQLTALTFVDPDSCVCFRLQA